MKCRIVLAKESLNINKRLLRGPLDTKLRNSKVKCFVWNVIIYRTVTRTLQKMKRRGGCGLRVWIWKKIEEIYWKNRLMNEEMVGREGRERRVLDIVEGRRRNCLGDCMQ